MVDPTSKLLIDKSFNPSESTLEQCLSHLEKATETQNSYYNSYNASNRFEDEEWQIKEFKNTESKLEGNKHANFHKNYALLVFYGLIQFRNYQANNFNILFLAFS